MSIMIIGKQSEVRKYLNKSMKICTDGFGLMYYDPTKRGKDGVKGTSVIYRTLNPLAFKYKVKGISPDTKIAVHCRYAEKQIVKEKNCFPQASLTMGVSLMCGETIDGVIVPNNEQNVDAHYWLRTMELKYHTWDEAKTHLDGINECMVFMDIYGKFSVLHSELGKEVNNVWIFSPHVKADNLYTPHKENDTENKIAYYQNNKYGNPKSNFNNGNRKTNETKNYNNWNTSLSYNNNRTTAYNKQYAS